jgi:hypothetical protein
MSIQSFPGNDIPATSGNSGRVLTTDGASAFWGPGSGMTLLASGFFSGPINLTSIPGGYQNIMLRLRNVVTATTNEYGLQLNGNSNSVYSYGRYNLQSTPTLSGASGTTSFVSFYAVDSSNFHTMEFTVYNYANTTANKLVTWVSTNSLAGAGFSGTGRFTPSIPSAITSINSASGSFTGGTYELFGIK